MAAPADRRGKLRGAGSGERVQWSYGALFLPGAPSLALGGNANSEGRRGSDIEFVWVCTSCEGGWTRRMEREQVTPGSLSS